RRWRAPYGSAFLQWRSAPWSRRRKRQTSHLHGSPCPVWALASPYPGCREVKRARRRGQSGPETIGRTDAGTSVAGWSPVRPHPPGSRHTETAEMTETPIRYATIEPLDSVAAYRAAAMVGAKADPSTWDSV